jgi:hypothetical protein
MKYLKNIFLRLKTKYLVAWRNILPCVHGLMDENVDDK